MSPPFAYLPDADHEAAELRFGNYVLVIQPGDCHGGEVGHHLALYPAFVLRDPDPDADHPVPLWDALLPATLTMRPTLRVLPGGRQAG